MSIRIKKGIGNSGSDGGGGASFPTVVTDSGSSLPVDLTGYNEGDTFLNTSDKKIYKAEEIIAGYSISADVSNGVDVDLTTGIATGFGHTGSGPYVYKAISKQSGGIGWTGNNKEYRIHFKLISSPSANTKYAIYLEHCSLTSNQTDVYMSVAILNKRLNLRLNKSRYGSDLFLDEKDLCATELVSGIEYYLKVVKNGNSASVTLATDGYDENIIDENTIETQDLYNAVTNVRYGYNTENYSYSLNSGNSAQEFTIGQIYLADSTGNLVTQNIETIWDSGTSLTDKTEYADKTNGALYLYENSELVKIGGSLTKKVYTISADNTSTLDVSSDFTKIVDVLKNGVELALTDDYTISSGVITFVTALSTTDKITVKGE